MSISQRVWRGVIMPGFYLIYGDSRFRHYEMYKKSLQKTGDEIRAFQLERLQALVKHAYETVPYYRKAFDSTNLKPSDISTFDDIKKIPELQKNTVLMHPNELKSRKWYRMSKHYSGGSTGNKVYVWKDQRYHEISRAVWMRDLWTLGIRPGMKCAWIWGDDTLDKPFFYKYGPRLINFVNRRLAFNAFKYTDDEVEDWIRNKYNKWRPDYVYGYAGSIYDMAKIIHKRKIPIWQAQMVVTTSERLENRDFIQKVFKCPVYDHYGSSEVNCIAIENEQYVMHSSDDFVIVELNKDNEVLLTPLESYGMPLIRYKLGDVGLHGSIKDDDPYPFRQFGIAIGRQYEILVHKDGYKISGGIIKQRMEEEHVSVGEFQLIQRSLDEAELNIVSDKKTAEKAIERTKKIVCDVLGCKDVVVHLLDKFPTERNGKRIAFKCMVGR